MASVLMPRCETVPLRQSGGKRKAVCTNVYHEEMAVEGIVVVYEKEFSDDAGL